MLLKHYTTSTEPLQKKKYNEGILNIIKTKKNQIKLDKNYLMLLFKTNSFSDGIIILSEIMEDKEELLEIYKETKNVTQRNIAKKVIPDTFSTDIHPLNRLKLTLP